MSPVAGVFEGRKANDLAEATTPPPPEVTAASAAAAAAGKGGGWAQGEAIVDIGGWGDRTPTTGLHEKIRRFDPSRF